ncbi:MAG TPA: protein phosphatase CheZ [Burkholderiaceae bacterium]|nr:protein phosphatase CheZ [Burkholderiaceae bacterium]
MKMNELAAGTAAPEVFRQLGHITRQLHDALNQLGLMPRLQESAAGLPDARSRLDYIARKTGEAADKVLTAVEAAKREQAAVIDATRRIAGGDGAGASALSALACAAAGRTDEHLTEIMLAQDFHDLTGQVVAKVVALAIDLEDSLVKLLVQSAPVESATRGEPVELAGPRLEAGPARGEQLASQREVDDLLASLGF